MADLKSDPLESAVDGCASIVHLGGLSDASASLDAPVEYNLVNAVGKNPGTWVGCGNNDWSYLTPEALEQAANLFDDAAKAVAGNAEFERRVKKLVCKSSSSFTVTSADDCTESAGTTVLMGGRAMFMTLAGRWRRSMGRRRRLG